MCRDLADDFEQFQKDRKIDALSFFRDLLRETRLDASLCVCFLSYTRADRIAASHISRMHF